MKLYSSYRSNHLSNTRYTKEFSGNSVISVFQDFFSFIKEKKMDKNDDVYGIVEDFFGIDIYGGYGFVEGVISGEFDMPETLEELSAILESHWYINGISAAPDCIQIYTDVDEIDLAWYIFDETYAKKYPEKTILWTKYSKELPAAYTEDKKDEENRKKSVFSSLLSLKNFEIFERVVKKDTDKRLYMISVPIYDGEVIGGLEGAMVLRGLRIPEFYDFLKGFDITFEKYCYFEQLEYLSKISKQASKQSLKEVISSFVEKPLSEVILAGQDLNELFEKDFFEIENIKTRNEPTKSFINMEEHMIEISVNTYSSDIENYYEYYVFFDDLWASANPELAENLLNFAASCAL